MACEAAAVGVDVIGRAALGQGLGYLPPEDTPEFLAG